MSKLTDRELNSKLMETMNITSSEAKRAFEELMKAKVDTIRQEVRQEVYEEFTKQSKHDKENIINSMNEMTHKIINEEMKKIDLHRKNLIKEKIAIKQERAELDKKLADNTAMVKEDFNAKLRKAIKQNQDTFNAQKDEFISKASQFMKEAVNREVSETHSEKKQLAEALGKFSNFISDQVSTHVKNHREEMKSLDALRVRLVKENAEKLANSKKEFFSDAANKMESFINESVSRELTEFRQQIAEARRNSFGQKLFEAFAREYTVKFFNEDKVVKSLVESLKSNQNKLLHTTKLLEGKNKNLEIENKNLKSVSNKLARAKIINESIAHLAKDKQDMVKNLVKDVPTDKLNESIKKYIPMILSNSNGKSINKNERVLRESKTQIRTGEKTKQRAMDFDNDLNGDLDAEIAKVVASGKF